jgi:hypothetical protein
MIVEDGPVFDNLNAHDRRSGTRVDIAFAVRIASGL